MTAQDPTPQDSELCAFPHWPDGPTCQREPHEDKRHHGLNESVQWSFTCCWQPVMVNGREHRCIQPLGDCTLHRDAADDAALSEPDPPPRDRLRALVEAEKAATPGPWEADPCVTEPNGSRLGASVWRVGEDRWGGSAIVYKRLRDPDAALIAASRNLAPALAEFVLSLSPEDEGMVERVARAMHDAQCEVCAGGDRWAHGGVGWRVWLPAALAVLASLRAYADEKIGEA